MKYKRYKSIKECKVGDKIVWLAYDNAYLKYKGITGTITKILDSCLSFNWDKELNSKLGNGWEFYRIGKIVNEDIICKKDNDNVKSI